MHHFPNLPNHINHTKFVKIENPGLFPGGHEPEKIWQGTWGFVCHKNKFLPGDLFPQGDLTTFMQLVVLKCLDWQHQHHLGIIFNRQKCKIFGPTLDIAESETLELEPRNLCFRYSPGKAHWSLRTAFVKWGPESWKLGVQLQFRKFIQFLFSQDQKRHHSDQQLTAVLPLTSLPPFLFSKEQLVFVDPILFPNLAESYPFFLPKSKGTVINFST